MACHESIGIALVGLGETGHSAELPKMLKIRLASGQHLMDIRLVTHIKNQAVFHCIKNGLDGDRKLHRTQIGSQVAAGFGYAGDQKLADFRAQLGSVSVSQGNEIIVTADIL